MSMWTDLLLAHGFVATPRALAALTRPTPRPAAATTAAPTADNPAPAVVHPLIATGQLR